MHVSSRSSCHPTRSQPLFSKFKSEFKYCRRTSGRGEQPSRAARAEVLQHAEAVRRWQVEEQVPAQHERRRARAEALCSARAPKSKKRRLFLSFLSRRAPPVRFTHTHTREREREREREKKDRPSKRLCVSDEIRYETSRGMLASSAERSAVGAVASSARSSVANCRVSDEKLSAFEETTCGF